MDYNFPKKPCSFLFKSILLGLIYAMVLPIVNSQNHKIDSLNIRLSELESNNLTFQKDSFLHKKLNRTW